MKILNVIMDSMLPTLSNVCATVQREETRKKAMNSDMKPSSEKTKSSALLGEKNNIRRPSGT